MRYIIRGTHTGDEPPMRVLMILVAFFTFSSFCSAEPSPPLTYLMTEPVTLFDLGILRLHEYVEGYAAHYLQTKPVEDIYSTVTYDATRNKILISFVVTRKPDPKRESPSFVQSNSRSICRTIIQDMRREFFVGRNWQVRRSSGIYRFFAHVGFRGEREPLDCYEAIEKMTLLGVSVYSHKDPGKLILHGESPLMDKDIIFGTTR
jgi:hypothetical protein